MQTQRQQSGFSLMEVNMAVFVMAIGVLSMVVLYPLGLRESTQGQADLKQSIFADFLLNQAVAAASLTNFPWSQWKNVPNPSENSAVSLKDSLPDFMRSRMHMPEMTPPLREDKKYVISCSLVPGFSDKLMGVMVQSTDLENVTDYNQYSNNPVFYAEVLFQGDPNK
jgi:hypothetical protein